MAAENIGNLIPTKIPGYSDAADIQAALRLYHYGSYSYDPNESNPSNLVNPSIAHTINGLQTQINNFSGISPDIFNAKGDLLSATADNTPAILSTGSNGQVLSVSTGASTGLAWTTPEVTLSNTATLTNKTLTAPVINISTNARTASYTLILSDASKIIEMSSTSANTLTVPLNSSEAFPIGTQIIVLQTNTGQTTIAGSVGVTVNATPGLKLRSQWSSVTLIKRGTDSWVAIGDLVA
jgi:hypothetical protein